MKNKPAIAIIVVLLFLCGCVKTGVRNTDEYKKELMEKYPPYEFKCAELVSMRYPTLDELIERTQSDVSFIVADEVTPLEPVSFKYESAEADYGTAAIEDKMDKQGISPGKETIIYPYEITLSGVYGGKDISGKAVFFITQYYSAVPETEGQMGILVSGGADLPAMWKAEYEKAYPAADTYVCLIHPELSYYYISEDDTIIPMCRHNEDEYNRLAGLTLKEFGKMLK